MTPAHHPGADLLVSLASGQLTAGAALVVSAHVETCAQCRATLRALDALGGQLLVQADPMPLSPDALARTLSRIDGVSATPAPAPAAAPDRPALPAGVAWPRAFGPLAVTPWRWMGPGMRFIRVPVPGETQGSVYLLWIGPGKQLARHTHSSWELTQVLCGTFDDGRSTFGPGDFDETDASVLHRPEVPPGDVCVCLAYVRGKMQFEGRLASLVADWVGL